MASTASKCIICATDKVHLHGISWYIVWYRFICVSTWSRNWIWICTQDSNPSKNKVEHDRTTLSPRRLRCPGTAVAIAFAAVQRSSLASFCRWVSPFRLGTCGSERHLVQKLGACGFVEFLWFFSGASQLFPSIFCLFVDTCNLWSCDHKKLNTWRRGTQKQLNQLRRKWPSSPATSKDRRLVIGPAPTGTRAEGPGLGALSSNQHQVDPWFMFGP